ncbi:hypothetical protein O9929_14175 [Vibrio lentus]|nr:hypothetical protein [Vibrio lentus]
MLKRYTSYEETVYYLMLDLPDNIQLQSALTWMRDIGDGLDSSSSEVEKRKARGSWRARMARLDDKSTGAGNFLTTSLKAARTNRKTINVNHRTECYSQGIVATFIRLGINPK